MCASETSRRLAVGGQKPQEGPQNRRDLLHGDPTHAPPGISHERIDLGDLEAMDTVRAIVICEEAQEVAGEPRVSLGGRWCEAANPCEVSPIGSDQPL